MTRNVRMTREEFDHWLETNLEDTLDSLSSDSRTTDKWIRDLTTKLRTIVADDDDDLDVDDADDFDPEVDEDDEEEEASF